MASLLPGVPAARGSAIGRVSGAFAWLTEDWRHWFQQVKDRIDATAARVGATLALAAQSAAAAGTLLTATEAGLYRVTWTARVTQAATTSSSLAVSIGATADGVTTSQAGAALTSNTVGAVSSGSVLVEADTATAITYATAYSSVGATSMLYALSIVVERLP
jgi:hypothetical protein